MYGKPITSFRNDPLTVDYEMTDKLGDLNYASRKNVSVIYVQMEIDVQTISIVVAAISVVIGVLMSILSMRNYTKSRQASIFLDFHRQADMKFIEIINEIITEWNWNGVEDFNKKYGPITNPKGYAKFILVASFFDSMGKLIEANTTSIKLIPESLAVFGMAWYEKIESIFPILVSNWRTSGSVSSTVRLYKNLKKLGYRSPVGSSQRLEQNSP